MAGQRHLLRGTWLRESGELEVRGQAVRTAFPDTAHIRVGAAVEGKDELDAQTQANTIVGHVIDALRELGVAESQIKTSSYDVSRTQKTGTLLSPAEGYQSRITLDITLQDFALINTVLDVATQMGANHINGITFSCSTEGQVYEAALVDAIAAARSKAETMASAAGVELYTLLSLQEGAQSGFHVANAYTSAGETQDSGSGVKGTQIMAGEIEIAAAVTMIYQIK